MSTSNAGWFYSVTQPGDVVEYTGTNRPMTLTNGYGDWNLSWDDWVKGFIPSLYARVIPHPVVRALNSHLLLPLGWLRSAVGEQAACAATEPTAPPWRTKETPTCSARA